jgi:diguanylate cyclase (GGDEF)-like protein
LLQRFAILSVVSVATILLLVGAGLHHIYRAQVIEGAKINSVNVALAIFEQERHLLVETTPGGGVRIGVADSEFPALDQRVRNFLGAFGIVKVKVYDVNKKIVYSTDRSIIGVVDAGNARLEHVLRAGEVDAQWVQSDKVADLHGRERFDVDVVETYLPVHVRGAIVGSFEVYVDVSPAYDKLPREVMLSIAVLATVLVVVFGVLYIPMRQGTLRLAQVQDRLRELASMDMLTGLFNRRQLFVRIGEEYARMKRGNRSDDDREGLAFIMADIDFFKAINDARGHLAGDEVLRQVAERLKATLRPYDVIGRYGGEEFLVMLPHTGVDEAELVAERMRQSVAEKPFDIGDMPVRVTASFGVALSEDTPDDAEAVIRRADEGLCRAKKSGRNRVVTVGGR